MHQPPLFASQDPVPLPPTPTEDRLYTYQEVAAYCLVSKQTVMEWVKMGKVESPLYLGPSARFTREQLLGMAERIHPAGTFEVKPSPKAATAKANVERRRAAEAARIAAELARKAEAERAERERAEAALLALAKPARQPKAKTAKAKTAKTAKAKTAKAKTAKAKTTGGKSRG